MIKLYSEVYNIIHLLHSPYANVGLYDFVYWQVYHNVYSADVVQVGDLDLYQPSMN